MDVPVIIPLNTAQGSTSVKTTNKNSRTEGEFTTLLADFNETDMPDTLTHSETTTMDSQLNPLAMVLGITGLSVMNGWQQLGSEPDFAQPTANAGIQASAAITPTKMKPVATMLLPTAGITFPGTQSALQQSSNIVQLSSMVKNSKPAHIPVDSAKAFSSPAIPLPPADVTTIDSTGESITANINPIAVDTAAAKELITAAANRMESSNTAVTKLAKPLLAQGSPAATPAVSSVNVRKNAAMLEFNEQLPISLQSEEPVPIARREINPSEFAPAESSGKVPFPTVNAARDSVTNGASSLHASDIVASDLWITRDGLIEPEQLNSLAADRDVTAWLPPGAEPRLTDVSKVVDDAPAPTPETNNVLSQIVEQAKLISRPHNAEMVIKLTPEHLGELTLQVVFDEAGAVNAVFHSNNGETRSIIEASLPQLKQELQNQGLKVEYVGIYAGMNNFSSNEQQQGSRQFLTKLASTRIKGISEAADTTEVTYNQLAERPSSGGVDYRI